jgi:predicted Rossmann fold nucleotide-binding protein DprA/Smf involved in DNA uptake
MSFWKALLGGARAGNRAGSAIGDKLFLSGEREARAYADRMTVPYCERCVALMRNGQSDKVPQSVREAFAKGNGPAHVNSLLYNWKLAKGTDLPLP